MNYLTSFLIIVFSTSCIYSQTQDKRITEIDKITQRIKNNISNYQKTVFEKDSTGKKYVYKDNYGLKLIIIENKEKINEKYTHKKVAWYFSNGHLIYTEQTWTEHATNKIKDHQKCYLDDTHLIFWKKFEQIVDPSSEDFKGLNKELTAFGKELIQNNK